MIICVSILSVNFRACSCIGSNLLGPKLWEAYDLLTVWLLGGLWKNWEKGRKVLVVVFYVGSVVENLGLLYLLKD